MKRTRHQNSVIGKWLATLLTVFVCSAGAEAQSYYSDGGHTYHLTHGTNYTLRLNTDILDDKYETFGWFTYAGNNQFTFKGPDGYYSMKADCETHKTDETASKKVENYIRVFPMASKAQKGNGDDGFTHYDEDYTASNYDLYDPSTGKGGIFLAGGENFGFPNANEYNYVGWSKGGGKEGGVYNWGDNAVAMFKSETDGKTNTISITTGKQMVNNKGNGNFVFKFYHSPEFEVSKVEKPSTKDDFIRVYEFRKTAENDADNKRTRTTIELRNNTTIDYLYISERDKTKDNYSIDNGNVTAPKIGFDSDLPKMPDGYTFKFTIDLNNLEGKDINDNTFSKTHVPLDIEITGRVYDNRQEAKDNKKYICHLNNTTGLSGSKRIKLRDALRFDCDLLYAKSYDATTYTNVDVMEELVITGELDDDDMEYLTWLARHDRIKKLDLSEAKLPQNKIPNDFAHSDYKVNGEQKGTGSSNENLTTVIFPSALETIGGSAFMDCTKLTTIDISGAKKGQVTVGDNAFHSCVALSSDQINAVIERTKDIINEGTYENCTSTKFTSLKITDNITQIWQRAFYGDAQLTDVTVPASASSSVKGKANASDWNDKGEKYNSNTGNLSSSNTTSNRFKIEAEDFNNTEKGWYHSDTRYEGETYRSDNVTNGIKANSKFSNGHDIGYNDQVDGATGWNWFNYTFYCAEKAYYTVGAGLGSGNAESKRVEIKFSDDETAYTVIMPAYNSGRTKQTWGECEFFENTTNKVLLEKGWHVMHVDVPNGGIELDYFTLTYAESFASASSVITNSIYENSWEKVVPNHCEVHFTGYDETNNYREYRKPEQNGWRYLLTKDIYENNSTSPDEKLNYDVCNQKHADVRLYRVLPANSWDSMVLPFDVYAGTDQNDDEQETTVRTEGNHIKYAAIYFAGNKNGLKFLNVGGHNTTGGTEYGSSEYRIKAGTPFVIRIGSTTSDNIYKFVNVETFAKNSPEIKIEPVVIEGSYKFDGTYNAEQYNVESKGGVWAFSNSKIVHATKTAKFKGYRCWFEDPDYSTAPTATTAKLSMEFEDNSNHFMNAGIATGIDQVDNIETTDAAYTLSGLRTTHIQKGVYIINGKKVVVK